MTSTIILILALLTTPLLALTPPCPPGYIPISNNTTCFPCPAGTYSPLSSPLTCLPCPLGTYSPVRAAQTPQVCRSCPRFTYSVSPRAFSRNSCVACPFAIYTAHRTCLSCPKDFRLTAFPYTTCEACPPLALTPAIGTNDCTAACLDDPVNNTYITAPLGQRRCTPCPIGTGAIPFGCAPCNGTLAQYNDASFSGCRGCPPGFRGFPPFRATRCVPCPPGTARDTFVAGAPCYPCPPGFNSRVTGGIACVPDRTTCPSNFFRNSFGACDRCGRSQRYVPRRRLCAPCARNAESAGGLATACAPCAPPAVGGENGCVCPPGTERRKDGMRGCRACAAGSVNPFFEGVCAECAAGSFAPRAGLTECRECPLRYAAPAAGSVRCDKCGRMLVGASLMVDGRGERLNVLNRCVSRRSLCPPGATPVQNSEGWVQACNVDKCAAGTFRVARKSCASCSAAEEVFCLKCSTAERYDPVRNACVGCEDNEVSGGGVATKCERCSGAEVRVRGKCMCASSVVGEWPEIARGVVGGRCVVCPAGTFGVPGGSVCYPCVAGTAQGLAGQFRCSACGVGFFSASEGSTKCEKCADGLASIVRYSEATAFLAHTRVQSVGSASCVKRGGLNGS